ncbi:MAG: glycosyltransferase family A protein [Pyrinomonadaceae bacterium]
MNAVKYKNSGEVFAFVPSYNHAPFVEKCLKSIFKQTLPPKKLLVIDDGSKDNSPKIIERILKDCPFDAELTARENRGLSATLNEGFSQSTGDYFAYLSSDDVWLPSFLKERTTLLLSRPEAILAFGHAFLIDEQDRIFDSTANWTEYQDVDMLPLFLRGIVFPSSSVVYRRALMEKYKWNEDSILEDYELYLNLCADACEFAFDQSILSAWRQHGWNVSGDYPLMLEEWIAAQNRIAEKLNIAPEKLKKNQTELKFNAVADYIRHGRKSEAFSLLRENLRGAKSVSQIAEMILRLSIPRQVFAWNRNRKKKSAVEHYGKLEI